MTEAAPVSQSGSRVHHEDLRVSGGIRQGDAFSRDVRVVAFEEESKKMSEATVWTDDMLVNMLKEDLGRRNPSEATLSYFNMLIVTAKKEIGRERVAIPEQITDPADVHLVVTYASWLYRKRAATGEDSHMPRSLRYLLNNRAFSNQEVTTDAGTDG